MSELEIWNELGNIYYATGAYDESIRAYHKAIELDHGCRQSYDNLASIYIHKGQYSEAIPMLHKVIELLDHAPDKALLWDRLGDVYRKMGDYENTLAACRNAVGLDPENAAFKNNLEQAEAVLEQMKSENSTVAIQPIPVLGINQEKLPEIDSEEMNSAGSGPAGTEQAQETESVPEPVSDPLNTAAEIVGQAPESAQEGKTDSAITPKDQADAVPEPGLMAAPNMETSVIDDPAPQMDSAKDEINNPDQAKGSGLEDGHIAGHEDAETPGSVLSSETETQVISDQTAETLLIGQKGDAGAQAVESRDNHFEALRLYKTALVETDQGIFDDAIRAYQKAASLDPEHIFPWNKLGILYSKLDRYEEALAAFHKAIEHDPKDAPSWNGLGDVYHKLGRNEDAIAAYQLGNVFEQQNSDDTSQRLENLDNEIATHRTTDELDPETVHHQTELIQPELASESAASNTNTGCLESELKTGPDQENPPSPEADNKETASPESHVADTIESDPVEAEPSGENETVPEMLPVSAGADGNCEPDTSYWVFKARESSGKSSQPATRLKASGVGTTVTAVKPSPTSAITQFADQVLIGSRLLTDGNEDATVVLMEQEPETVEAAKTSELPSEAPVNIVSPHLPKTVAGKKSASRKQANQHSLEKDIAAYRKVTEINPQSDRAWDALGNMYEAMGLHTEAITAFEKAVSLNSTKEVYHYHLGLAHAAQMHYDKAIHALQKVISLNPEYMLAHCALAGYYRRVGKEAEAQEHIAIARPSIENENEYNRACFEAICGNVDQAIAFLKTALEKQQIQLNWVRNDPDLDLIRTDPRFEALLGMSE